MPLWWALNTLETLSNNIVNLEGIALASSITIRNLGVIFDQELSFNSHVKQISRIAQICHILSEQDAEKLVHVSVTQGWTTVILYFQVALTKLILYII